MNGKQQESLISIKETCIKCCKCYVQYWKSIREKSSNGPCSFTFDLSIEKVKSFRKYFSHDKTLYHFCVGCFGNVIAAIPIPIVEFETGFRNRGGCVVNVLMNNQSVENVCNGYINFVIENFSNDDFIIL